VHRALPGKWAEEEANPAPELDDIVEKKSRAGHASKSGGKALVSWSSALP